MATNRKKRGRSRRQAQISETAWAMLNDLPLPANGNKFERFILESPAAHTQGQGLKDYWNRYRDAILADWTSKSPCTRPSCWWRFDAPRWEKPKDKDCYWYGVLSEPRKRIGGTGTPAYECLNYVPSFTIGVPDRWVSAFDVDYYNGRAVANDGSCIGDNYKDGDFDGIAVDPDDPPTFESQAAYLKRHGLLTAAEVRWLDKHPEALEPEAVKGD